MRQWKCQSALSDHSTVSLGGANIIRMDNHTFGLVPSFLINLKLTRTSFVSLSELGSFHLQSNTDKPIINGEKGKGRKWKDEWGETGGEKKKVRERKERGREEQRYKGMKRERKGEGREKEGEGREDKGRDEGKEVGEWEKFGRREGGKEMLGTYFGHL